MRVNFKELYADRLKEVINQRNKAIKARDWDKANKLLKEKLDIERKLAEKK